jgi:DNA mismatch repair ATPase MutS
MKWLETTLECPHSNFQVLKLKKDNPGVLLMVEVGYKLKFFDDDAKVNFRIFPE